MFGKKKNKDVDAASTAAVDTPAAPVKVKKKKGGMSSIFKESVMETVMTDFKENDQFIHKENGEDKYVGIMLDTKDIGGLDKKSKKVEAKGQLIECINSGRIKTVITQDLMDEECIVFIPEAFTLNAMDEFSLLTDAKYELCNVYPDGDIECLGKKVTYSEITDILTEDGGHIDDILGSEDDVPEDDLESDALLDDDASAESDTKSDDESDDWDDTGDVDDDDLEAADDDDIPTIDDDGHEIPARKEEPEDVGSYVPPVPNVSNAPEQPVQQNMDAANPQPEETAPETENEIPQEWSEQTIVRKFYSDALGLEISIDPFDAQFMDRNTFVPFEENRPSSWLNDNLNEMSRVANDEMNRMHQNNLFLMRERYFRLISMHCDKIRKDLDINDPTTLYGQMKNQLDEEYQINLQSMDGQIQAQKEELDAAWKQRLQEVGMDAAREAQHKYRERYQPAHEQKVYDIADAVKANIEAEHNYSIHDLNERRRIEASALLDLGISEVLDEVSEMYTECLEAERVRCRELTENMKEFQADYVRDDNNRTAALAEELRQTEKADAVLAEQTQKIRSLSEEYAAKRRESEADIKRLREENQARLADMKVDCEKDIARVKADKEALNKEYHHLLDKYNELNKTKDEEYKARMNEYKDELEAWSEKYDNVVDLHKRNNRIATFFVIATVIAAVAIGFIGGEFTNSKRNVNQQLQAIQQQYQQNNAGAAQDAQQNTQTTEKAEK